MEPEFIIVPSMHEQNTFYLFRDYAIEIKFTSIAGIIKIVGKGYFTPKEALFINEHLK